jgi:hypothetical protein
MCGCGEGPDAGELCVGTGSVCSGPAQGS